MNALDPRAPFARATIFQHALRWLAALPCAAGSLAAAPATDGWESRAARREIEPMFSFDPTSGNAGRGALIITADQRPGLTGHWVKTFPVVGGRWYSFRAYRRTHGVEAPARRAHVEIAWSDDAGKSVLRDTGEGRNRYALETFPATAKNWPYMARPEFPRDGATDAQGWTEVTDRFCAPPKATRATPVDGAPRRQHGLPVRQAHSVGQQNEPVEGEAHATTRARRHPFIHNSPEAGQIMGETPMPPQTHGRDARATWHGRPAHDLGLTGVPPVDGAPRRQGAQTRRS